MYLFRMPEIVDIKVAVCGSSGSGKKSLVEKMNNYIFTRAADRRTFRAVLTICSEVSISLFSDFDFVFFTFDATGIDHDNWDACLPWMRIMTTEYSQHSGMTCLVGTKLDLVPPDSLQHIALEALPPMMVYWMKLKCIFTSVATGIGLDDVVSYAIDQCIPPPPIRDSWYMMLDAYASSLFDTFASVFALPVPPNVNAETENILELPDDDVVDDLCQSPECVAHNEYLSTFLPKNGLVTKSSAFRITPLLMAKYRHPLEWDNTVYARSHLNIPIPQPRYPHLKYSFVTDYIPGRSLLECWDSLSFYMRFRIACTLRGYISQMRSLTRTAPGSPNSGHIYGYVFSLGSYGGPFASSGTFQRYIEAVTFEGWRYKAMAHHSGHGFTKIYPEKPMFPRNCDLSLMFTHADISPGNLILSDDGVLWLIDWATCGFYPKWVEALSMYRYTEIAPCSWKYLMWFTVGPPPKEGRYWNYFRHEVNNGFVNAFPGTQVIT